MFPFFLSLSRQFSQYNCEPKIARYVMKEDADLIQVHVVSRHGARTPLYVSKNYSKPWKCSNTEKASFISNATNSIKIHVAYGKSILLGNCHFGQLIGKGVKQLVREGSYFRDVYVKKLKFLPEDYREELCRFRTTGTQRTIHSQMAIANGLYPGNKTITMEVSEKLYDPWKRTSNVCPNFMLLMKNLSGASEWKANGLDETNFTQMMESKIGVKWSSVNDFVTTSLCQGFGIPPNITMEDVDKAVSLRARQHQFLYNHDRIFPLFFGFQASEMLNEMTKRINGESILRFIHWSCHDGNINAFLGYLGIVDGVWPPYGSFMQVELYKYRKSKAFFLMFRYNGQVLQIPRFSYSKIIPLNDFINFVKSHLPDLISDCGFDKFKLRKSDVSPSEAV